MRRMCEVTYQGLKHSVVLAADRHDPLQVRFAEGSEVALERPPAGVPYVDDLLSCLIRGLELGRPVAIGLFPIGCKEIGPARAQISPDVFHDRGDAVRFRVEAL